ncbi:hypothetical protein ACSQ67_020847 [Phaseolus vulgaris]
MAHLVLFFVLVFGGQVIGGFSTQKLPPPDYGNMITILTIDSGGIKGIIPAKVLDHLDKALKAKDPNADIAHYFDVIGGTSTGGFITAMLATPSPHNPNRGAFTPAEIVEFYKQNGPQLVNPSGEPLHNITRELLRDTRLSETLTNVVIPAVDLKTQKPVIFSNYKLKNVPYFNALMSDICISTSALPVALPVYYFENDGVEFNMIDGGLAAGDPTQAAVSGVLQHYEYPKILVLSLGTGITKFVDIYDAQIASNWTDSDWLSKENAELVPYASAAITEYNLASLFSDFQPNSSYLRIQEYNLNPDFSDPSNVTQENMDGLEDTGKQLLQEKVVKRNLDTFDLEQAVETNAEALDRLADILYGERQHRLKRKSMEKGGRPFPQTLRVPSEKLKQVI